MSDAPLSLLFLWHQHQPLYKDNLKNRYELPWVRLHATKDYYDMVALLDEYPTLKANFNLVPSLLAQLDDYAQGKAQDRFIELTVKKAADLTSEDQLFLLNNFFMAHWDNMIEPHARYTELLDKRGRSPTGDSLSRTQKYFKEQDWRDLQVWFNLAWFDPWWRDKDEFIRHLVKKAKHFTEDEKQQLVHKQQKICGLVVAKHKELQDRGQIEISTTPYYHPILPLLCDTEAARMAMPQASLPRTPFRHPEDAQKHVQRAIDDYTRRFGQPPKGMWPAEGSVSKQAAEIFVQSGLRWVATDEGILARSLGPSFRRENLFEPYRLEVGGKSLNFFFRDHELSDAIGFVYATWDPETAATDFLKRLHAIRSSHKGPKPPLVSVILDGENCWEHYKDDGLPFLRALYSKLAYDPKIHTVRAFEYLDQAENIKTLPDLWAGSWINSNFAIWIGHREDNTAWELLLRTRQFLERKLRSTPDLEGKPAAEQAWEEIYIAEGSDWCWWYGDDHSSGNDVEFDYLFRKHLMNVYTLMGENIPDDLHSPIKRPRAPNAVVEPADFINPVLDGRVTNYFEWQNAGHYSVHNEGSGTMQKTDTILKSVHFGFDTQNLYFRLDLNPELRYEFLKGISLKIIFQAPKPFTLEAKFDAEGRIIGERNETIGAYKSIIEFSYRLQDLNNPERTNFELAIAVLKNGQEQERWPTDHKLKIPFPDESTFVNNWHV